MWDLVLLAQDSRTQKSLCFIVLLIVTTYVIALCFLLNKKGRYTPV